MIDGTAREDGATFDPYVEEDRPAGGRPTESDAQSPVGTERHPGAAAEAIERATAALGDDDGAER